MSFGWSLYNLSFMSLNWSLIVLFFWKRDIMHLRLWTGGHNCSSKAYPLCCKVGGWRVVPSSDPRRVGVKWGYLNCECLGRQLCGLEEVSLRRVTEIFYFSCSLFLILEEIRYEITSMYLFKNWKQIIRRVVTHQRTRYDSHRVCPIVFDFRMKPSVKKVIELQYDWAHELTSDESIFFWIFFIRISFMTARVQ